MPHLMGLFFGQIKWKHTEELLLEQYVGELLQH